MQLRLQRTANHVSDSQYWSWKIACLWMHSSNSCRKCNPVRRSFFLGFCFVASDGASLARSANYNPPLWPCFHLHFIWSHSQGSVPVECPSSSGCCDLLVDLSLRGSCHAKVGSTSNAQSPELGGPLCILARPWLPVNSPIPGAAL